MAILVVCTGCKKSFQVNDQYAGKSGPCPKCKTIIRVPEKSQEVKIHTPEEFGGGGRGAGGRLALKPIARSEVKIRPWMAAAAAGAVVAAVILTWLVGRLPAGSPMLLPVQILGLLVLSPPLAIVAYTFLRDDELEPYRGIELYLRAAACAVTYAVLWGVFAYVKWAIGPGQIELWMWAVILPPFMLLGSLAAWLAFDIEPSSGFFHYSFYVLVTVLLARLAGMGWVWANLAK